MVYLRASSLEQAFLKSPFLCDHTHAHDLGHHYKLMNLIFSYTLDPLLSCRHTFSSLSQILQVQNEIILQKMCLNLFSSGIPSSMQLHCLYKITQFRNQAKPYSWFLMSVIHFSPYPTPIQSATNFSFRSSLLQSLKNSPFTPATFPSPWFRRPSNL